MGCKQSKDKKEEASASAGEAAAEAAVAEGETAGDEVEGAAPKLVVVFGATGAQGGSVIRAFKEDKDYKVRAVTRNPEGDKAKALVEEGFEVMEANSEDPESLKKALEGAYGVYAVTNYWEVSDIDKEIQQGKNMVDAAKEAGVEHFLYSGLESVEKAIGKKCGQFDAKAAIEEYMEEKEIPYTSVRLAFYYENLLAMMKPTKSEEDGTFVLGIPMGDVPLAMLSVKEIGECVHQIFRNPEEYKNKKVGLSGDSMKIEEYAAVLSKALEPKKFADGHMTTEAFAGLGFPGAEQLGAMFEFYQKGNPVRDVELTRKLNENMPNFDQWVNNNKDALDEATN